MLAAAVLAAALVCGATAGADKKGCKLVMEEVESCTVEPKQFCTPHNCRPGSHTVCEMVEESHGSHTYRQRREAQPAGRRRRESLDSGRRRRQAPEGGDPEEVRRGYEAEVAGDILLPSEDELREILARPTKSVKDEDEEDEEDEDEMLDDMLDEVFKEMEEENMVKKESMATDGEESDLAADYDGEDDYDYTEAPGDPGTAAVDPGTAADYDYMEAPTEPEAPAAGLDLADADYGDYGGAGLGGDYEDGSPSEDQSSSEDESSSGDYDDAPGGAPPPLPADMVNAPPSTSPSPSYTVPPSYTAPPSYSAPPSFTAPSSFDSAVPIIQPFYSPPSGHYGFVHEPVVKKSEAVEYEPEMEYEGPEPVVYHEPVVLHEPEPVVYHETEPMVYHEPEPVVYHEPVVLHEPEPVVYHEPEPVVYNEPEPVVYNEPEPVVYHEPEPVVYHEPEPVVYHEPEPVVYHEPEPVVYHEPEPMVYHEPEPEVYYEPAPTLVRRCQEVPTSCSCRMGTRQVCTKRKVQVKKCPKSKSAFLVTKLLAKIGAGINKHLVRARPWVSGPVKTKNTEKPIKTKRGW